MNLRSHYPYFLLRSGVIHSFPSLQKNIKTDIAIIGAGISGSIMAHFLGEAGFDLVVLDRRHAGMGSTAASTSLLQYEIDTPLYKLIQQVGERNAVRSYALCIESIEILHQLARKVNLSSEFQYRPSFQFASARDHVSNLKLEFNLRRRHNLSTLEWLTGSDIRRKFGFSAPAGILSEDGAQVDGYRLCHALLGNAVKKYGSHIFDNTEITQVRHRKNGVELVTDGGKKIRAKVLIICAGYESQRYISKRIEIRNSTYAIASEPQPNGEFWYRNSLIWETSNPYRYLRLTSDNRIIIGGKDDKFYDPQKRDSQLPGKAKALLKAFHELFPKLSFTTDFEWAGTFCGTRDGLPYIGSIPQRPHTFFALGFGGNGMTFSAIAAKIIRDRLKGKQSRDFEIFSFDR
ncbi:MAG TPA: FAD-dependent oxidoreductase [Ohtaekwangia sp.]